jgi:hypothetical protein
MSHTSRPAVVGELGHEIDATVDGITGAGRYWPAPISATRTPNTADPHDR